MGLVLSAFSVVYAFAMIPGSWIGDKIGAHKMLAICGVLWATGTLLTGLAGGTVTTTGTCGAGMLDAEWDVARRTVDGFSRT